MVYPPGTEAAATVRDKASSAVASAAAKAAAAEDEQSAAEAAQVAAAVAASMQDVPWAVSASEKTKFDAIFAQMGPEDGFVSGGKVAPVLKKSGLGNDKLKDIWNLVDVNKNGVLDADYFAVAMHLTMKTKRGQPLPESLTPELIPPAHR